MSNNRIGLKKLKYLFLISLQGSIVTKFTHWIRVLILSTIILSVSYVNFFLIPHQYNVHIAPYQNSLFDFYIDIGGIFSQLGRIDKNLTPPTFAEDLIKWFESRGINVNDYVLSARVDSPLIFVDLIVLSDISKLKLTEYQNIIYGDFPSKEEVLISPHITRWNVSIDDNTISLDGMLKLNYSGIYMGGVDAIVIDYTLYRSIARELDLEPNIFSSDVPATYLIYIDFEGDIDKSELVTATFDLISFYKENDRIIIPVRLSEGDILENIDFSIIDKNALLRKLWNYYSSIYLNPFSEQTFVGVGSFILFIAYLTKVVLNVLNNNSDIISLIYSIGGDDKSILFYIVLISIYYTVFPIILSFLVVLYFFNGIYGFYFTPALVFSWIYPYIFIPLILIFIASSGLFMFKLRREGLAKALSLEF